MAFEPPFALSLDGNLCLGGVYASTEDTFLRGGVYVSLGGNFCLGKLAASLSLEASLSSSRSSFMHHMSGSVSLGGDTPLGDTLSLLVGREPSRELARRPLPTENKDGFMINFWGPEDNDVTERESSSDAIEESALPRRACDRTPLPIENALRLTPGVSRATSFDL